MNMVVFDTLAYSKRLQEAGVPSAQAEAHAIGQAEFLTHHLLSAVATKTDMAEVKTEMAELKAELKTEMAGMKVDYGGDGNQTHHANAVYGGHLGNLDDCFQIYGVIPMHEEPKPCQ